MYPRAVLGLLPRPRPATLPPTVLTETVTIDRDHLARYAGTCGFPLTDTVPVTYPHLLAFPLRLRLMAGRDFPFPMIGLVHLANRITQYRPVATEELLELRVHATDLRPHRRGWQFDMVTVGVVNGREVWHDTSTYLRKGKPGVGQAGDRSGGVGHAGPGAGRPFSPSGAGPVPPEAGGADTALPTAQAYWRVDRNIASAYAAVSGDHNPIHLSYLAARTFGFARPIAHGMWTKARVAAALAGKLPKAFTIEVAFKAPITLPSKVGFAAPVRADGVRELVVFGRRTHLTGRIEAP
jgi:acyl dehydratase